MFTWVWLGLVVVARLGAAQGGGGAGFLPVPVWKFMNVSDGADPSDLGRPQFGCGDVWLSVRLRLLRHSDLSLEDGRRLPSLPDKCGASSQTFGSWLLLKFPYGDCPVTSLVLNGTNVHQLKLRYFDHLLQDHVTAEASCRDPAARQGPAAPLVRCTAADVTVKLPLGGRLQRVEALGEDAVVGTAITTNTTADAVFIQISRTPHTDSFLEITLLDSAGEMSTVVSACLNGTARDDQPRAPKHPRTSQLDDEDEDSSEADDEDEEASDSEADDDEDASDPKADDDEDEDASESKADDEDEDADDDEEDEDASDDEDDDEDASDSKADDDDDDDDEDASDSEADDDDEDSPANQDEDTSDSAGDQDQDEDSDSDSEADQDEDSSEADDGEDEDSSDSAGDQDQDEDSDSDSEADQDEDSDSEADQDEDSSEGKDEDPTDSAAGGHAGSLGSAANNTASSADAN